jgi:hypothetical protein
LSFENSLEVCEKCHVLIKTFHEFSYVRYFASVSSSIYNAATAKAFLWIDVKSANLIQIRNVCYVSNADNQTRLPKFSRLKFKYSGCDLLYRLHDIMLELSAYCWVCLQGYNELLYAHLLDSDGARLTYTHFTAKVRKQLKGISH